MTEPNLDWLISVDDHVLEPANVWVDRVAAKDRDRAPHMEFDNGLDYWVYDGKRYPSSGLSAVAALRQRCFEGEIVVVSAEDHLPYDRPPLSKQMLTDGWAPDASRLRTPDEVAEKKIRDELHLLYRLFRKAWGHTHPMQLNQEHMDCNQYCCGRRQDRHMKTEKAS